MKYSNNRPVALVILDGWGFSTNVRGNAIAMARTPNYDDICGRYPFAKLHASGRSVGLKVGVSGNAEIGHVNIGAGRVVQTDAVRIANAIADGTFFDNPVLVAAFERVSNSANSVHFIGLLSDGDVHSSTDTLYSLLRMAKRSGIAQANVHAILDGRDVPTRTADVYLEALEIKMADIGLGRVATICGRHFGMDNAENWERTARAFTMLVHGEGERANDPVQAVRSSFLRGITDEFVAPIIIESEAMEASSSTIRTGDLVIFFNHRPDTMRQIVRSIAVPEPGEMASLAKPNVDVVCLTEYDHSFNLPVAFPPESRTHNLCEIFADLGIHNYRISEADRFAHVTNFFNGGIDGTQKNELHLQVPQPSRTVDRESEPEMRSFKIVDSLIGAIESDPTGVFVVNIPAPGLIAETGNLERTIEAVQYVDTCLGGIVDKIREADGVALITSTHGNCERMLDDAGGPDRLATQNQVPLHIIDEDAVGLALRDGGSLCDVAPTILGILGIEQPTSMTGSDLRFSQS